MTYKGPQLRIESDDPTFSIFYEELAQELDEGGGTVFVPYIAVPPNARMALPLPREIFLRLSAPEAVDIVSRSAEKYLATGHYKLRITSLGGEVILIKPEDATSSRLRSLLSR